MPIPKPLETLINPLAAPEANVIGAPLKSTVDFLNWIKRGFTRHNAVRVVEGFLGVVLILVAVAELGKGTAAGNLAKKVPFI